MGEFVPSKYVERVDHLALGVEALDAIYGSRLPHAVSVVIERAWAPATPTPLEVVARRPAVERHHSGLHAVRYAPGALSHLALRFDDPSRRYVPRRLLVPVATAAEVRAEPPTLSALVRRVTLFPGAAHAIAPGSTALRLLVRRGAPTFAPVPWARVEAAVLATSPSPIARGHGDDRGECVVVLAPDATRLQLSLLVPLRVRVRVFVPLDAFAGSAGSPPVPHLDPTDRLAGAPIERVLALDVADAVSRGEDRAAFQSAPVFDDVVEVQVGRVRTDLRIEVP